MKKMIMGFALFFSIASVHAQVEVAKLVGKGSKDFTLGFGAFIKLNHPISEADYVSLEGSFVFFFAKESDGSEGMALLPVMLGYRHTLDGSGTGFYIEPQAGYTVTGALSLDPIDRKITGFTWAAGAGYLFEPGDRIQFDIGIRYESVLYSGGSANFISLRWRITLLLAETGIDLIQRISRKPTCRQAGAQRIAKTQLLRNPVGVQLL